MEINCMTHGIIVKEKPSDSFVVCSSLLMNRNKFFPLRRKSTILETISSCNVERFANHHVITRKKCEIFQPARNVEHGLNLDK